MTSLFKKNINLFSILTGNIMIKGSLFISWIIAARLLGTEGFGLVSLIKTVVLVSTLIFLLGTPNEIIRIFSISQKKDEPNVKNEIISGLLLGYILFVIFMCFVALFLFDFVNELIFDYKLTYFNFLFFLIFLLCYSLSIILSSILNGLSEFTWQGFTNIILSFCCIPLIYLSTKYFEVNGALIAISIIYLLQSLSFILKLLNSSIKFIYNSHAFLALKKIFNMSKYIFLHEVFYSLSNLFFLVFLMKSLKYSDLGIYNSGDQLSQMILFIPMSVLGYFLNQVVLKSKEGAVKFRNLYFIYSLLFTLVIACLTYIFKDQIVKVYGAEFVKLNDVFWLFVISIIPQLLNSIFQQNLIADSRSYTLFKITFFNSLLLITGVIILSYFDITILTYFIVLRLTIFFINFFALKTLS